jgi:DNA repair protein RadC
MGKNVKMKEIDAKDRPRERFLRLGPRAMRNAELLALLIGSGNEDENAVELMERILAAKGGSLVRLGQMEVGDFRQYPGIGTVKGICLAAAFELARRRAQEEVPERKPITSSEDIYKYFRGSLAELPREECHVLLLTQALTAIGEVKIGVGGLSSAVVDVRLILREALMAHAPCIALCHNHPSGHKAPSRDDDNLTAKLKKCCEVFGIDLVDHIIITDHDYYSYADENRL